MAVDCGFGDVISTSRLHSTDVSLTGTLYGTGSPLHGQVKLHRGNPVRIEAAIRIRIGTSHY